MYLAGDKDDLPQSTWRSKYHFLATVEKVIGKDGAITYEPNPVLQEAVNSFGVLNDQAARDDWNWERLTFKTLEDAVKDFDDGVKQYRPRIKSLELFGA